MILGPGMARVAAHEFAANLGIEASPEAGEIGGGLHGALIGGEELEHDGNLVGAETRCFVHSEKVLKPGGNPGSLAGLVMNFYLAAGFEAKGSRSVFAKPAVIDTLF